MRLYDTHFHLDLQKNVKAAIEEISANKIYTIAMTNLPVLYEKEQKEYEDSYIRIALGFHPELIGEYKKYIPMMWKKLPSARYVGEVGLDFSDSTYKKEQLAFFEELIEKCREDKNKILSIHSRKAEIEVLNCLRGRISFKPILHWYTGNIKNIEDLDITLTTEPGVYAITGENGAGKSTLLSCATYTFNRLTDLNNYLGTPQQGAYVMYDYGGVSARLEESNGRWKQKEKIASRIRKFFNNPLRGFLEGSVSFGNRFKNAGFSDFPNRNDLAQYPREVAPDFVKEGMGVILQNDIHYYDDLTIARAVTIGGNKNDVYFYTRETQEVDQFHMSTGENLLASVLGALHYKNERQQTEKCPCMVYLDEIEFGLHPAALKRLVEYFREVANTYNYAIYFSTHSLAIINEIEDENIYYLRKKNNGETKTEIEVVTPCAPAYATNMIYNLRGFDDIIIVEDEKARKIVNYIIKKEKLVNNRLVHIIHAG